MAESWWKLCSYYPTKHCSPLWVISIKLSGLCNLIFSIQRLLALCHEGKILFIVMSQMPVPINANFKLKIVVLNKGTIVLWFLLCINFKKVSIKNLHTYLYQRCLIFSKLFQPSLLSVIAPSMWRLTAILWCFITLLVPIARMSQQTHDSKMWA